VPVVMVSCAGKDGKSNIITVAWAGTVNSEPPMLSVSIRKQRHSHKLISETGEFVVNLVTQRLVRAADYCGVVSGRDVDKFEATKLTPVKASRVNCPLISESPVNIECKVRNVVTLGSHDMFIGEIVCVNVDDRLIDPKGKLHLEKAGLTAYSHGEYWKLGDSLGFFGFSVASRKAIQRRRKNEKNHSFHLCCNCSGNCHDTHIRG
jgi:flavin reductase (DIM6/NTAB) family NADH-FMN oxidoreductase RutF